MKYRADVQIFVTVEFVDDGEYDLVDQATDAALEMIELRHRTDAQAETKKSWIKEIPE